MRLRLLSGVLGILFCLLASGCFPPAEGKTDEKKDPYFQTGRDRVTKRDYKGAIEAFEKALEDNPRSAMAHYELGMLYEQHENDYAAAIYHYSRVLKIRPGGYPADNARQRIVGCRQELAKNISLAPVAKNMVRDLERLKEDNERLKAEVEKWKSYYYQIQQQGQDTAANDAPDRGASAQTTTSPPHIAEVSPGEKITPLPDSSRPTSNTRPRVHYVRRNDTFYSISRQYGIKLDALRAANPGVEPRHLRVGQTLKIPSS